MKVLVACEESQQGKESRCPMTPQPKEYIITEKQLNKISFDYVANVHDPKTTVHDRIAVVNEVRSRPHQPAAPYTEYILAILKKRYRNEAAIQDYIEMIECEVIALKKV